MKGDIMRKIALLIMAFITSVASFGGCTFINFIKEKELTMKAHYDYGLFQENKATLLLDSCNFFFSPADYGIGQLLAGNIVHITHTGDLMIAESYPGMVITKNAKIKNITVEEANIIELEVKRNAEGEVSLYYADCVYSFSDVRYVIHEDGTFEELSEKHIGSIIYGTEMSKTSVIDLQALYSYCPRGEINGI